MRLIFNQQRMNREQRVQMFTWTPRIPNTIKKAQQMRTIFPMGLKDVIRVSTTSFRPGARLITLRHTQSQSCYISVPDNINAVRKIFSAPT